MHWERYTLSRPPGSFHSQVETCCVVDYRSLLFSLLGLSQRGAACTHSWHWQDTQNSLAPQQLPRGGRLSVQVSELETHSPPGVLFTWTGSSLDTPGREGGKEAGRGGGQTNTPTSSSKPSSSQTGCCSHCCLPLPMNGLARLLWLAVTSKGWISLLLCPSGWRCYRDLESRTACTACLQAFS